ncbi:DUF4160 domain-containing protein [Clostridium oryzae]|uniref:DUF4160 domain-containing protein n=1 Tax=Clostridium oryzae TaxID=1450648 RepID=A0A1V4IFZ8_9CLOT|nr:DUF4160 domain-containing protein [Clostridium oryzae]OPJ58457.1 hypothetical protein CLORY_36070 [Clostridium oryzae]
MPVITRFFGIVIKMYPNDHLPPHFHAIYGECVGMIDIKTLEMIEGDLSNRALKLIREWANKYQEELMDMWNKKEFRKLEGLE